jgi:hypothetical protein
LFQSILDVPLRLCRFQTIFLDAKRPGFAATPLREERRFTAIPKSHCPYMSRIATRWLQLLKNRCAIKQLFSQINGLKLVQSLAYGLLNISAGLLGRVNRQ